MRRGMKGIQDISSRELTRLALFDMEMQTGDKIQIGGQLDPPGLPGKILREGNGQFTIHEPAFHGVYKTELPIKYNF